MANRNLEVIEENGSRASEGVEEDRIERLVALGRALPACTGAHARHCARGRFGTRMLRRADPGVPASEGDQGLCICNFQGRFSMGQFKVFSRLRTLKDAGLVLDEKRGNSSFYSLDWEAVQGCSARPPNIYWPSVPGRQCMIAWLDYAPKRRYEVVTVGYEDLS